jgi:formylglycine-generating enzyme
MKAAQRLKQFFLPQKRPYTATLIYGFFIGALFIVISGKVMDYTSTDQFCMSCHVHPHAEENWRLSVHYDNKSGIVVHCVQCHLPPTGSFAHYSAKAKTGLRDVYAMVFKDTDKINWEAKRHLEPATRHTWEESCIKCHQNFFPLQLSQEGMHAHLYFEKNRHELNCLNCHLHVGHYSEVAHKKIDFGFERMEAEAAVMFDKAAEVSAFESFNETIPGTGVSFRMLPIPGGRFAIGSPVAEPGRSDNEGPQRQVELSPFFMSEIQVSWDMYLAFFRETMSEGRSDASIGISGNHADNADAISGPTPPWGSPDQGWGWGDRPAITMTYYAAETFCRWLSQKTGKTYRLPTEAEWEYAARGATSGPYFFDGSPKRYSRQTFRNRIFGADTATINSYVIYEANSLARTQSPQSVKPNPFGLKNMLGNVWEFCSDFYADDAYTAYPENIVVNNPTGPASGMERVIRGGSFRSDAYDVRAATRNHTRQNDWLRTDPQIPKSIWWYSDVNDVGFRVVMEWDSSEIKQ